MGEVGGAVRAGRGGVMSKELKGVGKVGPWGLDRVRGRNGPPGGERAKGGLRNVVLLLKLGGELQGNRRV